MARGKPLEIERELLEAFHNSGLLNEYLVEALPEAIWRASVPGGRGRTIAAIFAHLESVRRSFARMGGARPDLPALDRKRCTPAEAQRALRQTTDELGRLFREAFAAHQPRVKGMPRRAVNMLVYLVQHDSHHRGQICMLARDLGHKLSPDDVMRLWGWKALPPSMRME